mmetsp:Transcript_21649/g.39308  ORF Transcript_21649/g.39308 Transcript_21649/m.39308 type:complete len:96 (+) Transcript_21649:243-530(+)
MRQSQSLRTPFIWLCTGTPLGFDEYGYGVCVINAATVPCADGTAAVPADAAAFSDIGAAGTPSALDVVAGCAFFLGAAPLRLPLPCLRAAQRRQQ